MNRGADRDKNILSILFHGNMLKFHTVWIRFTMHHRLLWHELCQNVMAIIIPT
jgi:hypothetical protein